MPNYLSPGVYVEEVEAGSRPIEGVGTAVAAFVGLAAQGPFHTPTLVNNWSQYTNAFGEFVEDYYLAHAVYGYFLNGGGACYVVRVGGAPSAGVAIPALPSGVMGRYRLVARAADNHLAVEVADPAEGTPEDRFTLIVKANGGEAERFENLTTKRGRDNVVTAVSERSRLITVELADATSAPPRPASGTVELRVAQQAPTPLVADEYAGDAAQRTGFGGLEAIDDITMVACPDLMSGFEKGSLDAEAVKTVQLAMIAHCELMGDRVAILDPLPGMSAQQVKEWRMEKAGYDSKYATLYYPWIKVFDAAIGTNRFVPPSGHMAGVWARNDSTRGVHKAPANEVVRGAVEPQTQLIRSEQELLNPIGVNCIRAFPGRGVRVWGARTLSSDPAWRYVNVRRLFNYLEESILGGTQWVVFEPNDHALWARIRRTIAAFLVNEWRRGALFGLTPDEAFYVKCDDETNPAESIDAGLVVCEIGVAPVKPAEFVVFRLAQISGGTSLVSE
ncbi:MAG TPA: phage tail sheath subtilisin-like domain-containing protein [Candidatus Limnocylindrales bacterium]|nr:phage tail sheath subtilisin-like domain-containing protein [Candidatus Limnocylindrales bacterium]